MGNIETLHPNTSREELALIESILKKYPGTKNKLEKTAGLIEKKGVLCKYRTAEELEKKIFSYFYPSKDKDGKRSPRLSVSVSGLATYLGITTQTLLSYGQDKEYSLIVKLAKNRIEEIIVEGALAKFLDSSFAKFYMKNNHGRRDKQEVEHTNTEKKTFEISIIQPAPPPVEVVDGELLE